MEGTPPPPAVNRPAVPERPRALIAPPGATTATTTTFELPATWLPGLGCQIPPCGAASHELWPTYCPELPVTDWIDCDGNGYLDVCDIIKAGDRCRHIEDVRCDLPSRGTRPPAPGPAPGAG